MTICRRIQASSTCSQRVYSSSVSTVMMKNKLTKSNSSVVDHVGKVRAPAAVLHQYTTVTKRKRGASTTTSKSSVVDHEDSPPIAAAAAETRRKLVQVERLGGLKLRFRFSSGDIPSPPPVTVVKTNKLAVQEIISTDDDETNRRTVRSWRQMKLQREREAARRKMESMSKTVDISNNYYDTMSDLDRMFGDSEWVMEAFYGARNQKPLEKLGLFLKV